MSILHCAQENGADLYVNERQKVRRYRARSTEEEEEEEEERRMPNRDFFYFTWCYVKLCYIAMIYTHRVLPRIFLMSGTFHAWSPHKKKSYDCEHHDNHAQCTQY